MNKTKKILTILLSIIFVISVTGVTVIEHICNICKIKEYSYLIENKDNCKQEVSNISDDKNCENEQTCCTHSFSNKYKGDKLINSKCCFDKISFFKIFQTFVYKFSNSQFKIKEINNYQLAENIQKYISENHKYQIILFESPPSINCSKKQNILNCQLIL